MKYLSLDMDKYEINKILMKSYVKLKTLMSIYISNFLLNIWDAIIMSSDLTPIQTLEGEHTNIFTTPK